MLFEKMIDQKALDIDSSDTRMIRDLILGDYHGYGESNFLKISFVGAWLFDIVANKRNSIDVDKFDYIKRDTYFIGIPASSYDESILINSARVIDNQICYQVKTNFSVSELYSCRYNLYKSVYNNARVQCIELMLCDLMLEADPVYNFKEIIYDPDRYV